MLVLSCATLDFVGWIETIPNFVGWFLFIFCNFVYFHWVLDRALFYILCPRQQWQCIVFICIFCKISFACDISRVRLWNAHWHNKLNTVCFRKHDTLQKVGHSAVNTRARTTCNIPLAWLKLFYIKLKWKNLVFIT